MERCLRRINVFYALVLVYVVISSTSIAHAEPSDAPDHENGQKKNCCVEWFAIKAIGGLYGGGVGLDAFTLNWKFVFWDIIHGYPFVGGAHPYQTPYDSNHGSYAKLMVAGTRVGFPLKLGTEKQHELRFGVGILGGPMMYGDGISWGDHLGHGRVAHASLGPEIEASISYVYKLKEHLKFEVGLSTIVATRSDVVFMATDGNTSSVSHDLPWPVVQTFVGLRF